MLAPRGLAPTLHLASVMLGCQDTGQPMFGNYHQVPQSECQTCEKCLMMVVKVKVPILDILQCKNLLRVCKHLIVLCGSYRVLSPGIVKHFSHVWTQFSCSLWFSTFQLLGMWFVNCAEVERVSVSHQGGRRGEFCYFRFHLRCVLMIDYSRIKKAENGESARSWGCLVSTVSSGQCNVNSGLWCLIVDLFTPIQTSGWHKTLQPNLM